MRRRTGLPALALLAGLLLTGCGHSNSGSNGGTVAVTPQSNTGPRQTVLLPDQQTGAPLEPDPRMTPGDTLDVTVQDICVPGYTQKVRNVPQEVKRQVYAEYGITSHRPGEYEVDHLISLELGGSNSVKNLWPQSYETQPWNAHVKDDLENKLHEMVCSGQLDLATAQHEIATDWIAAYKKYFHTDQPLAGGGFQTAGYTRHRRRRENFQPLTSTPEENGGGNGQVWVNTRSGKYFHAGSPYYGNTKQGEYLTEEQAQQQGYTPARGQ
ncbi:MAG: hypothetical protein JO250_13780 [Armatimonadetes bacterium]|nr:hypothetical protein [Armatimonadota bacterium]